jgi:hypothetical protein
MDEITASEYRVRSSRVTTICLDLGRRDAVKHIMYLRSIPSATRAGSNRRCSIENEVTQIYYHRPIFYTPDKMYF